MIWIIIVLVALLIIQAYAFQTKVRELEDRLGLEGRDRLTKPEAPAAPRQVRAPHQPPRPSAQSASITYVDDPRWFPDAIGDQATFTYVDADGVVTDREVRNWRSDGPYIKAFCLTAHASRTFRKDRIEDWLVHEYRPSEANGALDQFVRNSAVKQIGAIHDGE